MFDGGEYVYTPFAPSEGKFVTVEMVTTFPVCAGGGGSPGEGAQAAVRLAANGSFQMWTRGNAASVNMLPIPITNANWKLATLELATLPQWQH